LKGEVRKRDEVDLGQQQAKPVLISILSAFEMEWIVCVESGMGSRLQRGKEQRSREDCKGGHQMLADESRTPSLLM